MFATTAALTSIPVDFSCGFMAQLSITVDDTQNPNRRGGVLESFAH